MSPKLEYGIHFFKIWLREKPESDWYAKCQNSIATCQSSVTECPSSVAGWQNSVVGWQISVAWCQSSVARMSKLSCPDVNSHLPECQSSLPEVLQFFKLKFLDKMNRIFWIRGKYCIFAENYLYQWNHPLRIYWKRFVNKPQNRFSHCQRQKQTFFKEKKPSVLKLFSWFWNWEHAIRGWKNTFPQETIQFRK